MTTETKITEQQIVQQTVDQQNVQTPVEQQNAQEKTEENGEEKFTRYCEAESFQIPCTEGTSFKTSYKLKKNLATCLDVFLLFLFHRELAKFCSANIKYWTRNGCGKTLENKSGSWMVTLPGHPWRKPSTCRCPHI